MGVFKTSLTNTPNVFTKAMFGLRLGWIHFYKTTPRQKSEYLVMGVVYHVNGHATTHK
jgi:hypothetical protein